MTNTRWQSTASRPPCIQAGIGSKKATQYSRNGMTALRPPNGQCPMAEHGQSPTLHTGGRRVEKCDKIFTQWYDGPQAPNDQRPLAEHGQSPTLHINGHRVGKSNKIFTQWYDGPQGPE